MQTLNKRLSALEQANPTNNGPMFIHLVGLDTTDSEIERITKGGQEWQRQPGESQEALKDRALQVASPNPHGAMVFLCF